MEQQHPVVVIGAGPIGLAAAAHAHARGLETIVLESGPTAGSAVREWGHVRLFSPWSELVDPTAASLLAEAGWVAPQASTYPTGADWARVYLEPLADVLAQQERVHILFGHRVSGVARTGRDVTVEAGRDADPFIVHAQTTAGPVRLIAGAVIDASGTWGRPNPLGADGYPAAGEVEHADRIANCIPDLSVATTRARYAGRHVVVAGTGASAQGALVSLGKLVAEHPTTRVTWLVRRTGASFGGGDNDQLVERGALGLHARQVVESPAVDRRTTFRTVAVRTQPSGQLAVEALDGQVVEDVDEIVVATGFRPDLSYLSEVRLDLDPALQAPRRLAPLIDPNVHSCGTVYPHGAKELAPPESGLYLAGMKSYGRATSFLALTGFEQVRSIVAAVAGDAEAAARVELVLPETGVCGGSGLFDEPETSAGCCGSAEPQLVELSRPGAH